MIIPSMTLASLSLLLNSAYGYYRRGNSTVDGETEMRGAYLLRERHYGQTVDSNLLIA